MKQELDVATIEKTVKFLESQIPRCQHREVVGRCPYCDLCEHGKTRYSHCDPCHANDDQSWRTAPISDAEIRQLERWFADYDREHISPHHSVRRYTPYHGRNFRDTEVSFFPILIAEYKRLRAQAKKVDQPKGEQ